MNIETFNQLSSPSVTIQVFVMLSLLVFSLVYSSVKLVQIVRLKSRGVQVGWRKSISAIIAFTLCVGTSVLLHAVNLYSVYIANNLRDTYAAMQAYVDYRDAGCDECKSQLIEAADKGHLVSAALAGKGGFYSDESFKSVFIDFSNKTYIDLIFSDSTSYYNNEPIGYSLFYFTLKKSAPIVNQIDDLAPSVVSDSGSNLSADNS
jgi:hypothetical protein